MPSGFTRGSMRPAYRQRTDSVLTAYPCYRQPTAPVGRRRRIYRLPEFRVGEHGVHGIDEPREAQRAIGEGVLRELQVGVHGHDAQAHSVPGCEGRRGHLLSRARTPRG